MDPKYPGGASVWGAAGVEYLVEARPVLGRELDWKTFLQPLLLWPSTREHPVDSFANCGGTGPGRGSPGPPPPGDAFRVASAPLIQGPCALRSTGQDG